MDPNEREREVDQWLDSALRQYGKADARPGLEIRVLANLKAERDRIAAPHRWWWALGTAAAALAILAAVWVGHSIREGNRRSTAATSTTEPRGESARVELATAPQVARPAKEVAQRRPPRHTVRSTKAAIAPKLEQFPSPQPLSEQEQTLMSYVAKYPDSAALVAQAQAEALQRDREEEEAETARGNTE